MSTLKVNKIENTATTNGGVQIDVDGHVQVDGVQMPSTGPLSNRNLFFNGACEVNQRGTVSSSAAYGGPDRFVGFINATSYVCERSQQIDAPANTGLQKCFQLKTTTARTGTTADQYVGLGQILEFQDIYNAIWGGHSHVTVSFWVKSSITGTFAFNINPYNTDSGLSGDRVLYHTTYTIDSADTWEYKSITIPMAGFSSYSILSTADSAQIARGLEITWMLGISSGGNRTSVSTGWSATEGRNAVSSFSNDTGFLSTVDATFKLTGVQFEVGSKSTPFEHRSYGDELARCERYCQVYHWPNQYENICFGGVTGNTALMDCIFHFRNEMRTAPSTSGVASAVGHFRVNDWRGHDQDASSLTFYSAGTSTVKIGAVKPTANMTTGYMGYLNVSTSAGGNARWTFSAEL